MNQDPNATFDIPTFHEDFAGLLGTQWARGRYQLTKLLGQGTFGAVFEATDDLFQSQPKAIKLSVAISSDKLFFREAKLLGEIRHDNVVKVHDYGVEEGIPYIVMDLLEGDSVDKLLQKFQGRLPEPMLVKFVREIGSALHNVHLKNLVHRDLKPNNIIFAKTGGVDHLGQPIMRFVLLDFGIAGRLDPQSSLRHTSVQGAGTLEYMAPEQAQSQESTSRTDVYSFGVMLYQFLTGRVPFPATGNTHLAVAQVITALIQNPPPPFKDVDPKLEVRPGIEELVMQCLAKKPEDRPESVLYVSNKFLELSGFNLTSEFQQMNPAHLTGETVEPFSQSHVGTRPTGASMTVVTGQRTMVLGKKTLVPLMIFIPVLLFLSGMGIYFIGFAPKDIVPTPVVIPDPAPPPAPAFAVSAPPRLSITAGTRKELAISLQNGGESPAVLQTKSPSEFLEAPATVESESSFLTFPIDVDVNAPIGPITLAMVAKQGEHQKEFNTIIDVAAPQVWMPESKNFPVQHEGKIVTINGTNYYEKLIYTVPNEPPVRFVLIDPRQMKERIEPFYIMENKVWNSLFARFALERSLQYDNPMGMSQGSAEWKPLPALNMIWNDADRFGKWLGGPQMHMPTIRQWWASAGYFDTNRSDEFREGPFKIEAGVAEADARKPLPGYHPVGSLESEVSPHGIRDLVSNGREWTSSLYPPVLTRATFPSQDQNVFQAGGFGISTRPTFDYASRIFQPGTGDTPKSWSTDFPAEDLGFRLVLEPVP